MQELHQPDLYSQPLSFRLGAESRATGMYSQYTRIASDEVNNAQNSTAKSIAATAHWRALGLTRDPFAGESLFFPCKASMEVIERVRRIHLYQNTAILVQGVQGSGKTTLLTQSKHLLCKDGIAVCSLQAHKFLAAGDLLAEMSKAYGWNLTTDAAPQLSTTGLTQCLANQPFKQPVALLIDDAESLAPYVLRELIAAVAAQNPQKPCLHVVLFAKPTIEKTLTSIVRDLPKHALQTNVLKGFDVAETEAYLMQHLQNAGWNSSFPWSPAQIGTLWRATQGFPDAILQEARHSELVRPLPEIREIPEMPEMPKRVTSVAKPVRKSMTITTTRPWWLRLSFSTGAMALMTLGYSLLNYLDLDHTQNFRSAAMSPQNKVTSAIDIVIPTVQAATPNTWTATATEISAEAPVLTDDTISEPKKSAPKHFSFYTEDEENLLKASPKRFTLQIAAFRNDHNRDQFTTTHRTLGDVKTYRSYKDGRTLNIVVIGDFASKEEARQALAELPEGLQTTAPMIVSYKNIHKALEPLVQNR